MNADGKVGKVQADGMFNMVQNGTQVDAMQDETMGDGSGLPTDDVYVIDVSFTSSPPPASAPPASVPRHFNDKSESMSISKLSLDSVDIVCQVQLH